MGIFLSPSFQVSGMAAIYGELKVYLQHAKDLIRDCIPCFWACELKEKDTRMCGQSLD